MTTAGVMKFMAGASATGATVALTQSGAGTPQDWTVLGLLAAVVLGIGARLVAATEKNTAKLGELNTKLEVVARALEEGQRQAALLREDIKGIPETVAKECGRRPT
jgi:hypothetical protein